MTISGRLSGEFVIIRIDGLTATQYETDGPEIVTYTLTQTPIRHRTGWVLITTQGTLFLANCDDCGE